MQINPICVKCDYEVNTGTRNAEDRTYKCAFGHISHNHCANNICPQCHALSQKTIKNLTGILVGIAVTALFAGTIEAIRSL